MSGMKQMVINTQERALSVDINRAQLFKSQDTSELLRYWLDYVTTNDDDQIGTVSEPNTVETPIRAEIINGLLVRPAVGTQDVTVDPGIVMMLNPDGTADESTYKYVRDAGIPSPGTLSIAASAGGGTRIDVIECQINAVDLIATDNRDVFNPVTGLFTASVITKERSARLTYRVRSGTPGGGMPANQAGWLPLCVASVPNGSTTNDTVTFWDVRPLVSDREFGGFNIGQDVPDKRVDGYITYNGTGPVSTLSGTARMTLNGRRVGGILRRGSPGTDADNVVLTDAANQEPTYSLAADGFTFVYLAFPFGLPRWSRYTDFGSGSRKPRAPRGIVIVSNTLPDQKGVPSSALTLPTGTGLGSTTSTATAVLGTINRQADASHRAPVQTHLYERASVFGAQILAGGGGGIKQSPPSQTDTTGRKTFRLTAGTHYPKNAKTLLVSLNLGIDIPFPSDNGGEMEIAVAPDFVAGSAGGQVVYLRAAYGFNATNSQGPGTFSAEFDSGIVEIPVPFEYPGSPLATFDISARNTGSAPLSSGGTIYIHGWRT